MSPIQPILVVLLILGTVVYFARLRSRLRDRMLVLLLVGAAVGMVMFPEWTTKVAHRLGVGRGVDLIIYLTILAAGFCLLVLLAKLRSLEAMVTSIVREVAILHAEQLRSQSQTPHPRERLPESTESDRARGPR